MSLSVKDEQKIAELFDKKNSVPVGSSDYFKYRDEIFTHVLSKLGEYFSSLKYEWKSQFKISEEDAVSIIHDGLLAAVTNFKPGYESRNRVTKFLTYFTHILKNNVKNYITLNHVGAKRAKRNFHKMPLSAYTSLERLITPSHDDTDLNSHPFSDKMCSPILKYLSDKFSYFDSQQNQVFFIEQALGKMPEADQKIIRAILDGYKLNEIAKSVNMSTPGVKNRLRRLVKRFALIETELCQ